MKPAASAAALRQGGSPTKVGGFITERTENCAIFRIESHLTENLTMNYWFFFSLLIASAVMLVLEQRGAKVVLQLSFKGDIKRESLWLQQWGQLVATFFVMLFIYSFEPNHMDGVKKSWSLAAAVFSASMFCFVLKRTLGRVRPNRENAGKFLGPSWKHANWRESFPSSHSTAPSRCQSA
ncbi:MAG: phosphatase PAP2 family protein [Tepidisphaeraceae bacterium]